MSRKYSILIVDDVPDNIRILAENLQDEYTVLASTNGYKALQLAKKQPTPDLVLLDVMMPGIDGFEVCARLKSEADTRDIPVIFVTALSDAGNESEGLALGAVDYITKPINPSLVKARINNQLELKRHRDNLQEMVDEQTRELKQTQEITIEAMGALAEYRDPETGGHIRRTQNYIRLLANRMQKNPRYAPFLDDTTIELLYLSAPLHDIGKVGIRDDILLKAGKLTDEEFEQMKKHTEFGRDAIRGVERRLGHNSFLRFAREIAETHQEKWDGTGYPYGLSAEEIPVSGRLMAIADVYDALISKRVYKPPMSHRQAVKIISDGRGTHFDPEMVDGFLEIEGEFRSVAVEFADSDEERQAL
ncbi:MAG: two-component system response regulator [Gammaproteobacteria bacterium]|nr:two-component system response regulator [Gammaproteobacteria bacterium]